MGLRPVGAALQEVRVHGKVNSAAIGLGLLPLRCKARPCLEVIFTLASAWLSRWCGSVRSTSGSPASGPFRNGFLRFCMPHGADCSGEEPQTPGRGEKRPGHRNEFLAETGLF